MRSTGCRPAISIEQKTTSRSPRSTVGRSRRSTTICGCCTRRWASRTARTAACRLRGQTADQIVERIVAMAPGERDHGLSRRWCAGARASSARSWSARSAGIPARIDGEMVELTEGMRLDKRKNHTIEAIVDRIMLKPSSGDHAGRAEVARPKCDTEAAGNVRGEGAANGERPGAGRDPAARIGRQKRQLFSSSMACPDCGHRRAEGWSRAASRFNSTYGACPECHGLGSHL